MVSTAHVTQKTCTEKGNAKHDFEEVCCNETPGAQSCCGSKDAKLADSVSVSESPFHLFHVLVAGSQVRFDAQVPSVPGMEDGTAGRTKMVKL